MSAPSRQRPTQPNDDFLRRKRPAVSLRGGGPSSRPGPDREYGRWGAPGRFGGLQALPLLAAQGDRATMAAVDMDLAPRRPQGVRRSGRPAALGGHGGHEAKGASYRPPPAMLDAAQGSRQGLLGAVRSPCRCARRVVACRRAREHPLLRRQLGHPAALRWPDSSGQARR